MSLAECPLPEANPTAPFFALFCVAWFNDAVARTLVAQLDSLRRELGNEALSKGICGAENRPVMFNLRRTEAIEVP
jgi:hypothetical protein